MLRVRRLAAGLLGVAAAAGAVSIGLRLDNPDLPSVEPEPVNDTAARAETAPSEGGRPKPSCGAASGPARAVRERLTKGELGVGSTDSPVAPSAEIPSALATFLMGEVICADEEAGYDRSTMDALGEKLLSWPERYPSEHAGWGLPYESDTFEDGTINPANTVDAGSTALAVKALLDWAAISDTGVQAEVDTSVDRALAEWTAAGAMTTDGQLAFSLSPNDRDRAVFHHSVLLAGQLQRFAALGSSERSDDYARVADAVIDSLLRHRHTDRDGGWYWSYSTDDDTPNDLTQAGHVVDGVGAYLNADGALAPGLSLAPIVHHLAAFLSDGTFSDPLLPWPAWRSDGLTRTDARQPRLHDVGWTLSLVSTFPKDLAALRDPLCAAGRRYRSTDGSYRRLPTDVSLETASNPEIYEDVATYYLGLVAVGSHGCDAQSEAWRSVPFVEFAQPTGTYTLEIDPQTSMARLTHAGRRLDLARPGIPVAVVGAGGTTVAVRRDVPTDTLSFARWSDTIAEPDLPIEGQDDEALGFRSILLDGDDLYLVVYDILTAENRLRRYDLSTLTLQHEWTLPALEERTDPARAMELPIRLVRAPGDPVRVLAGTLSAIVDGDDLSTGRIAGCAQLLEAVAGPAGVSVLCTSPSGGYAVGPLDDGALRPISTDGVPYGLHLDRTTQEPAWHDSRIDGLAAWLEYELTTGQGSGTLDLGRNNRDGRIASSQIPYLDAMLDVLDLSTRRGVRPDLQPLANRVASRIDLELSLLETVVRDVGFETVAFTTDGTPALVAEQTARLARFYRRYQAEFPGARSFPSITDVTIRSALLEEHEETIVRDGLAGWVEPGRAFLAWRRGTAAPYDGANVPFHVQNEWALAALGSADPRAVKDAEDMLSFFYERVLAPNASAFPLDARWNSWWGLGSSGWTGADAVSVNQPSFAGDTTSAGISARSLDAESMLTWSARLTPFVSDRVRASAAQLVADGLVLPHVGSTLIRYTTLPVLDPDVAARYGRATTPSELGDALWAQVLAPQ